MFFIFTMICLQVFSLTASDQNDTPTTGSSQNSELTRVLKGANVTKVTSFSQLEKILEHLVAQNQAGILLRPKGNVEIAILDTIIIPPAAVATSLDSVTRNTEEKKDYPWLSAFYKQRIAFVSQVHPGLLPYFDPEVLQLLAYSLNTEGELDNLKEKYLWKTFLDVSQTVFKQAYEGLLNILSMRRLDGTIPFNFQLVEYDLYKKIVIEALKECLETKSLEYENSLDSLTFTIKTKDFLKHTIIEKVNSLVQLKIEEHHAAYSPYSSDKAPKWVDDYVQENLKTLSKDRSFIHQLYLPAIIQRLAYDAHEILTRNLNNEEQIDFDRFKETEETHQKLCLSFFYKFFYEETLKRFYIEFNDYKKENSLDIKDEEVLSLMSTAFERYPYNVFHVDPVGNLRITFPFGKFFLNNVLANINGLVEKKQKEKKEGDVSIPPFVLKKRVSSEEKVFNIKESRRQNVEAMAIQAYQRNQAFLSEQSKKYEQEQQAKIELAKKAAANKVKRQEEEKTRQEQIAQELAAKKEKERQQNIAHQVAAQELQKQKNNRLELLHQKRVLLYDFEDKAQELEALDIKKLIDRVKTAIEEQQKLFNNSKNLKKTLSESQAGCSQIDTDVQEIEQLLEKKTKQKNAKPDNECLVPDQPQTKQEVTTPNNSVSQQQIKTRKYTHNPYRSLSKKLKATDPSFDLSDPFYDPSFDPNDSNYDPFSQETSLSVHTNSVKELERQNQDIRPIRALSKAFYPERYL